MGQRTDKFIVSSTDLEEIRALKDQLNFYRAQQESKDAKLRATLGRGTDVTVQGTLF